MGGGSISLLGGIPLISKSFLPCSKGAALKGTSLMRLVPYVCLLSVRISFNGYGSCFTSMLSQHEGGSRTRATRPVGRGTRTIYSS